MVNILRIAQDSPFSFPFVFIFLSFQIALYVLVEMGPSLNLQETLGKQYDEFEMVFSLVDIGISHYSTESLLKIDRTNQQSRANKENKLYTKANKTKQNKIEAT